jgi:hypothetical protein
MRAAWLLVVPLGACTTKPPPLTSGAWSPEGYKGFVESIDALVGPNAVNCGYVNLLEVEKGSQARRDAYACVQYVLARGLPFKFGTYRIPIDSHAYEVLARAPDGKLWEITYDQMVDDDESGQQWNRTCRSVRMDRKTLDFIGVDCVQRPDGMLKPQ